MKSKTNLNCKTLTSAYKDFKDSVTYIIGKFNSIYSWMQHKSENNNK